MITNIRISNEKFNFINHITGKVAKDAIVPGKKGKNPIPNPVQKKSGNFLIIFR